MKKTQMNKKGITLTSLIIYITIMFVVLAIIMRVTTYYTKNMSDVADTSFEEEFEKFNMYMLQETNKSENYVADVSEDNNSITFTDGNTITFQKEDGDEIGEIHFNEIKICENVSACTFSLAANEETGKTEITVNLTINGKQKNTEYVMLEWIARLPIEYQEVEYIESTGTQYIDTGVIGKSGIGMNCEISFSSFPSTSSPVFGCYGNSQRCYLLSCDNNGKLNIGYINSISSNYTAMVDKRYSINVNMVNGNQNLQINGTTVATNNNATAMDTQQPIYLFGYNFDGSFDGRYPVSIRLYNLKLYENNTIVRDFIPCYNKSTGDIGLYDIVFGQFYAKSGKDAFLKGEDIKPGKVKQTNYIIEKTNKQGVSIDYQEVEYIESTGTQYIDTGVIGKSGIGMNCEISFSSFPSTSSPVFGCYGNSQRCYLLSCENNGKLNIGYINSISSNYTAIVDMRYSINVNMVNGNQNLQINGTTVATNNNATAMDTQQPIYLFGYNFDGSFDGRYPVSIRLYNLKLYENNTIVRDYHPCYRISDGNIGLYDVVNNQFYTNSGTGEFIKGPNVD